MQSIVGRWKDVYKGSMFYEFFPDGTYLYQDDKGPDVHGTYAVLGNDLITKSNMNQRTNTRTFKVDENNLYLTNPASGITGEYLRVKQVLQENHLTERFEQDTNSIEECVLTDEMKEVIRSAKKGDGESQFYYGKALALGDGGVQRNYKEAIKYLRLAGKTMPGAYNLLIGIAMKGACSPSAPEDFCKANPDLLIEGFEGRIYEHNNIAARLTFGAILCGEPSNRHVQANGGIPELLSPRYTNPAKGFRLITEGVHAAEKEESETGKDPIDYTSYLEVQLAYDHHTQLPREQGKAYHFEDEVEVCVALATRVLFTSRCYNALLEKRGIPDAIKNNFDAHISKGIEKTFYEAAVGKLISFIKIYVNRDALANFSGTATFNHKIQFAVSGLNESLYKMDKEIAEIISDCLRKAQSS